MKVWTNTQFTGHWPVGTAAVVVADTREQAAHMLEVELGKIGLPQAVDPAGFEHLPRTKHGAVILNNGDY